MTDAKVIADSVGEDGARITTLELDFPRFLLAQFNTHRMFSRNAQSSRAIPTEKLLANLDEGAFVPDTFGANQRGMQASSNEVEQAEEARALWKMAKANAVFYAKRLAKLGVHKQLANRLVEPYSYVKVLVTATEWDNFFALRLHHAAQPEMQELARKMDQAMSKSSPRRKGEGEWHVPFAASFETSNSHQSLKVATARCARISYLSHDGSHDPQKDIALHDSLLNDGHLSPFEHCAKFVPGGHMFANFMGWCSYRHHLKLGVPIE